MTTTSVRFRGREVQNPILRKLAVVFVVLSVVIVLPISLFIILPITLVLGTILHPFLKLAGRKGVYRTEGRGYVIKLDREAFRNEQ